MWGLTLLFFLCRAVTNILLDLNLTNLDPLTENYDLGFYLNYLNKWPSLFSTVKDHDAGIVGFSMFLVLT
jgi:hypothetical protein